MSIPDKKCLILDFQNLILLVKNAVGYHLGPVTPSTTDGAPLKKQKNTNWLKVAES